MKKSIWLTETLFFIWILFLFKPTWCLMITIIRLWDKAFLVIKRIMEIWRYDFNSKLLKPSSCSTSSYWITCIRLTDRSHRWCIREYHSSSWLIIAALSVFLKNVARSLSWWMIFMMMFELFSFYFLYFYSYYLVILFFLTKFSYILN